MHGYLCCQTRHQHVLLCDDRASHFALIFRHHRKHIAQVVWQIATRFLCGSAVYAASAGLVVPPIFPRAPRHTDCNPLVDAYGAR